MIEEAAAVSISDATPVPMTATDVPTENNVKDEEKDDDAVTAPSITVDAEENVDSNRGDEGILKGVTIGVEGSSSGATDDEQHYSSDSDEAEEGIVIHAGRTAEKRHFRSSGAKHYQRPQALGATGDTARVSGTAGSRMFTVTDEDLKKYRFARHVTAFDVDISTLEDKPWRNKTVDLLDYFNYGFNERTWLQYCEQQLKRRAEQGLGPVAVNASSVSDASTPAVAATTAPTQVASPPAAAPTTSTDTSAQPSIHPPPPPPPGAIPQQFQQQMLFMPPAGHMPMMMAPPLPPTQQNVDPSMQPFMHNGAPWNQSFAPVSPQTDGRGEGRNRRDRDRDTRGNQRSDRQRDEMASIYGAGRSDGVDRENSERRRDSARDHDRPRDRENIDRDNRDARDRDRDQNRDRDRNRDGDRERDRGFDRDRARDRDRDRGRNLDGDRDRDRREDRDRRRRSPDRTHDSRQKRARESSPDRDSKRRRERSPVDRRRSDRDNDRGRR